MLVFRGGQTFYLTLLNIKDDVAHLKEWISTSTFIFSLRRMLTPATVIERQPANLIGPFSAHQTSH